ncbi:MAG: cell division protein FtsL [Candidatus Cloacimonas sp. 4484_209]|nr:MAG: cell division protein FtsL [Candidatus Cloacimonas sp. 4484_209]
MRKTVIKRFFVIFFVFLIVVLLGIFYVWERATAIQLTRILAKKQTKLAQLKDEVEKLKLTYLNLTSVLRIEKIAKEQLKMKYPNSKEIKYIEVE